MRNEALAASKKNFTQEILNMDATLAEDRLLILVSKKASSGKIILNTILVFYVNGPEINFQEAFRLSGSEYFQTITLSGDYLIAAYPENRKFFLQYFNISARLK